MVGYISEGRLVGIVIKYSKIDPSDLKKFEEERKKILNAETLIQSTGGGNVIIYGRGKSRKGGNAFIGIDLNTDDFRVGTSIQIFGNKRGYYVIDCICAESLKEYSPDQKEDILTWMGEPFEMIAKNHGLGIVGDCLQRMSMDQIPISRIEAELEKTIKNILAAKQKISDAAHEYAEKHHVDVNY